VQLLKVQKRSALKGGADNAASASATMLHFNAAIEDVQKGLHLLLRSLVFDITASARLCLDASVHAVLNISRTTIYHAFIFFIN